jgi:hypothetical protein
MLVLTILLVVAGLALLLVGAVRDDLTLLYLSIGCTAVAGVILIVFSQQRRRRMERLILDGGAVAGPEGPTPFPPGPVTTADDGRPMPGGLPEGTGNAETGSGEGTGDPPTLPPGGGSPAGPS